MNKSHTQQEWFDRAAEVLPAAGFGNFDAEMIIREGHGSRVIDMDGREYVDLLIGSGPMLLGHGHPEVMEAVMEQLPKGMTFFANNSEGIALAEDVRDSVACGEQVRFVTSGGEADMYAIRLARAYTGRDKVLKFEGGYHGMSAEAQMSLAPTRQVNFPQAVPDSAGIPEGVREQMLIAPFNDPDYVDSILAEHGSDIACIIVEPLQRIIPPEAGFLAHLREKATEHGIVLIFDEIVTGYRLDYGGAQEAYGVTPDLCTLGKIVGGGFPLAAIAGRTDVMVHFDKARVGQDKWLMQLGTLSGNPVAAVAGRKTMEVLRRDGMYDKLRANGQRLMDQASGALAAEGIAHVVSGDPTLFEIVFTDGPVRNYRDYTAASASQAALFNKVLREHGLFKSAGKTYPSVALTDADFEITGPAYVAAAKAVAAA